MADLNITERLQPSLLDRLTDDAPEATSEARHDRVIDIDRLRDIIRRDLSWLRIERYRGVTQDENEAYVDTATNDTRFLPMLCQQCGTAPCEPVCY